MVSLADAVLEKDARSVKRLIEYGEPVNQIDEYGFTPLIEAAIINDLPLSELLLTLGANPNYQDVTGGTALQWATENNNEALCRLLLKHHANPNAYNFAGQPVLTVPLLRHQENLKKILLQSGANLLFAQDYINTKLIGHMFELVGITSICTPQRQFVEVDFEGFILEFTLGLIADSLMQFQNHFAARQLRRYLGLSQFIVETLYRARELITYQQYQVQKNKFQKRIDELLQQQPLIIPIGYEGHAISFILYDNIWVKCDRREDSRLYDNIVFYQINNPQVVTTAFIQKLIYVKQDDQFINQDLDRLLGLTPLTTLKVEAQISGNCSWANVEAVIPALFFLILNQSTNNQQAIPYYKTLALNFFHRWREWNKDRALYFCLERFKEEQELYKASKAEILAAVLFHCAQSAEPHDKNRVELILPLLINSRFEYLLRNYVKIYYFESNTKEGKNFYHLLKEYGLKF